MNRRCRFRSGGSGDCRETINGSPSASLIALLFGWSFLSGVLWISPGCRGEVHVTPAEESPSERSSAASSEVLGPRPDADPGAGKPDLPRSPDKPHSPDNLFADVTARTGIDFSYHSGKDAGEFAILESLGGGVAAFDYDRDGNTDLMFAGGGSLTNKTVGARACGLFQNHGELKFRDVTSLAGAAADAFFNHGIFPADFDGDGFPDLAVSGYGGVQVFRNQGDGTFRPFDIWTTHPEHPWSSSLAWGDFDSDGLLDLYVTHYVDWSWQNHPICPGARGVDREVCPPREFSGVADAIYLNRGNGAFQRVAESVGLSEDGKGLGVVAGDVNLDGRIDLYVANDTTDNFLYLNDGRGHFEETAMIAGVATDEVGVNTGSMGLALQDLDSDGLPDLWVTNFERELFALYRNEQANLFSHVSRAVGLAALNGLYVGFGTTVADVDCDGDRDIVVANGHVSYASPDAPYRQQPLLLENQGGTRFVQRSEAGYFAERHSGRGLASADLDNDGGIDLVFTHLEEPAAVLRGQPPANERWAMIELVGRQSNRDAIGASIDWGTAAGARRWMCNSGGSYLSQSERRLRVLLPAEPTAAEFHVRWPSGQEETFPCPDAMANVVWVEGTAAKQND